MDRKRIFLIIVFILAVLGIAIALYYVFIKKPPLPAAPPAPPVAITPPGVLPPAVVGRPPGVIPGVPPPAVLPRVSPTAQGGVTLTTTLSEAPVLNPLLTSDGRQLNFYNQNDGRFYRVGPDGRVELLSDKAFFNVQKITWAPQGDKGILEYPDGSKIFYDFSSQRQVTIPKHWEDFSFSPQGEKIAAKSIGLDPANRWLIAADPDGGNAELIEPMGENADKVTVSWSPNQQVIAFSETGQPLGFFRKEIILIGKNGERFNPLITEGLGFNPLWSATGDQLLYSVWNAATDYKPELWLTGAQGNAIGANRRRLEINTWADKCVFADNVTLYCAVPQDLPRGAGVERGVAQNNPDTLYKIDLTNGSKTLVATTDNNYAMNQLMISADKSILYFTDNNNLLQKMNLR